MKLQDIADMKEYLENRCYCPREIYDLTGFFFDTFSPDAECELIAEGERGAIHGKFVLASSERDISQIIYIQIADDVVESCVRVDATENNRSQIEGFMNGTVQRMEFDEYHGTNRREALDEILSLADAVMEVRG